MPPSREPPSEATRFYPPPPCRCSPCDVATPALARRRGARQRPVPWFAPNDIVWVPGSSPAWRRRRPALHAVAGAIPAPAAPADAERDHQPPRCERHPGPARSRVGTQAAHAPAPVLSTAAPASGTQCRPPATVAVATLRAAPRCGPGRRIVNAVPRGRTSIDRTSPGSDRDRRRSAWCLVGRGAVPLAVAPSVRRCVACSRVRDCGIATLKSAAASRWRLAGPRAGAPWSVEHARPPVIRRARLVRRRSPSRLPAPPAR